MTWQKYWSNIKYISYVQVGVERRGEGEGLNVPFHYMSLVGNLDVIKRGVVFSPYLNHPATLPAGSGGIDKEGEGSNSDVLQARLQGYLSEVNNNGQIIR